MAEKEYISRAEVKDELLSGAVCIKHPEHLMKEDALHVIDCIPAADVAPIRHGRWVEKEFGYLCSACDFCEDLVRNYCPNCGARMDGEC